MHKGAIVTGSNDGTSIESAVTVIADMEAIVSHGNTVMIKSYVRWCV